MWELIPREALELRQLRAMLKSGDIWSLTLIRLLLKWPLNWLWSKYLESVVITLPDWWKRPHWSALVAVLRRGSISLPILYDLPKNVLPPNVGWVLLYTVYGKNGAADWGTLWTLRPPTLLESSDVQELLIPKNPAPRTLSVEEAKALRLM